MKILLPLLLLLSCSKTNYAAQISCEKVKHKYDVDDAIVFIIKPELSARVERVGTIVTMGTYTLNGEECENPGYVVVDFITEKGYFVKEKDVTRLIIKGN